jgi:UV DNA damage endonuclease
MRIGYPCINLTLKRSAARTFRLASYSEARVVSTITSNLDTLEAYLAWNAEHDIRFFRISSGTIPLASHPVMAFDWQGAFADRLRAIGEIIQQQDTRTNVHPGQYTLINSNRPEVVAASIADLVYHAELLDLMGLDATHKIQIHGGGVYGDKPAAIRRFIDTWHSLPDSVRLRLVIENDERHYSLADSLAIHRETGIPVLFDSFHHSILNDGESIAEALELTAGTWQGHGPPMVDYSSQDATKQLGAHTPSIDLDDFALVLPLLARHNADVMLEIKDKEASALRAIAFASEMLGQHST